MKIATIATGECRDQAASLIASLRHQGYDGEVVVYTPEGYDAPSIPETTTAKAENWWYDNRIIEKCVNGPALCKPDIFLDSRWHDGTVVLYLDAADVLVNADPAGIANYLEKACLAAYAYKTDSLIFGQTKTEGEYFNNGVILAKIGHEMRMFAELWKHLLQTCPEKWVNGNPNYRQVGDQKAFNMALRLFRMSAARLPHEWNYRPGSQVRKLKVQGGRIVARGMKAEPKIIHCTGPTKMPDILVTHCTGGVKLAEPFPESPISRNPKKWTIIMPAFKAAEFISEAIDSLPQDVPIMIGVDGCRDTLEAIPKKRPHIRVFMFPAKTGPYVIRNTLAEAAECDRILFFDADDVMLRGGFEKIAAATSRTVRFRFFNFNHGRLRKMKKSTMTKAHGCFAVDRQFFLSTNGFFPWPAAADTEWLHRCDPGNVEILNDRVFARRKHPNSLTGNAKTGIKSEWRKKYRDRMNDNIKPEKLHIANCVEV